MLDKYQWQPIQIAVCGTSEWYETLGIVMGRFAVIHYIRLDENGDLEADYRYTITHLESGANVFPLAFEGLDDAIETTRLLEMQIPHIDYTEWLSVKKKFRSIFKKAMANYETSRLGYSCGAVLRDDQ